VACRNCHVETHNVLDRVCDRCKKLPRCRTCKRHLSPSHFDVADDAAADGQARCRSCTNKISKSVRSALGGVVTEFEMSTAGGEPSFDVYLSHHGDDIRRAVEGCRNNNRLVLFDVNCINKASMEDRR
jgi:hypothetical protein